MDDDKWFDRLTLVEQGLWIYMVSYGLALSLMILQKIIEDDARNGEV